MTILNSVGGKSYGSTNPRGSKLTIDMDLELLSGIVGHPVERLAYVGAHVDPETASGNNNPETTW